MTSEKNANDRRTGRLKKISLSKIPIVSVFSFSTAASAMRLDFPKKRLLELTVKSTYHHSGAVCVPNAYPRPLQAFKARVLPLPPPMQKGNVLATLADA